MCVCAKTLPSIQVQTIREIRIIERTLPWGNLPVFAYCGPSGAVVLNAKVAAASHGEAHWNSWEDPLASRFGAMKAIGEDPKFCVFFDTDDVNPTGKSKSFLSN